MKVYYHGGVGGLHSGCSILPPSKTDTIGLTEVCARIYDAYGVTLMHPAHARDQRYDRVYVTESYDIALEFAVYWSAFPWCPGNGSVYQVTPYGSVKRDPAFSFIRDYSTCECAWALVDEVIVEHADADLPPREKRGLKILIDTYRQWNLDHGVSVDWLTQASPVAASQIKRLARCSEREEPG